MSRIGKSPITVPDSVKLNISDNMLTAKGPKGELSLEIPEGITLNLDDKTLTLVRANDEKKLRSKHGLTRALVFNTIEGVANGFTRTLKIEGVGYKVEIRKDRLMMNMGFSHPLLVIPPQGITFAAPNPTTILISGIDKQLLGSVCAKVKSVRPPEPYKGKGIRFEGEYVRRKAGKTSAK